MQHIEINGAPPTVAQLYRAATINYGHFTSMQVRNRAVRGFALHLKRLAAATRELFGSELIEADVRNLILRALRNRAEASVRVTVIAQEGDLSSRQIVPEVMITVNDPVSDAPQHPWATRTAHYVRDLPHIKHVATLGLIHQWRAAVADGFDDALFLDNADRVSEGSAWNVVFWDGSGFVWPNSAQLAGITKQLLHDALGRIGVASLIRPVHREELTDFSGALATYSHYPSQPLARIDDLRFAANEKAQEVLQAAWATVALEDL